MPDKNDITLAIQKKREGNDENARYFMHAYCGDAFPIERVLVATYLLSVEALPHCRCGVANKSCTV